METFVQLTVNGLTLGSVYALIALGYTLVYGVLKLLNFAHGDVFMVGSFIGFGALQAIKYACTAGKGKITDRRAVVRKIKRVRIPNSILGGSFRFSTKSNDPLNAKFYIFQIQSNGSYKLVG